MTTKQDFIGLGMPPFLADQLGVTPVLASVAGTSVGSASQMGGRQFYTIAVSGTSGIKLPPVGGDTGILLGSQVVITNLTAAALIVYAANNTLGSAVTLYLGGVSIAGNTGVSIAVGHTGILWPATVSTWTGIKTSA